MAPFSSFIKDPKNTRYDGKDADEQILYVIRRSHVTNYGWVTAAAIATIVPFIANPFLANIKSQGATLVSVQALFVFTLFWYLAVFGISLFMYLGWYFNVYIITSKKILDFDFYGLTYKNISETTLDNVEDVTSQITGSLNMIFDIGDVFIQTAAEKREFDFMQVDNPGKIRDIIADMVTERKPKNGNN